MIFWAWSDIIYLFINFLNPFFLFYRNLEDYLVRFKIVDIGSLYYTSNLWDSAYFSLFYFGTLVIFRYDNVEVGGFKYDKFKIFDEVCFSSLFDFTVSGFYVLLYKNFLGLKNFDSNFFISLLANSIYLFFCSSLFSGKLIFVYIVFLIFLFRSNCYIHKTL
jgi:hypothetical protein